MSQPAWHAGKTRPVSMSPHASMIMTPIVRKCALTAHVTCSVGWLGAVVAYLALAVIALSSANVQLGRAAYLANEQMAWFVITPLCLAALATGLLQSLGTRWGLGKHYWVLAKLALTVVATVILLAHLPAISLMANEAARARFVSGGQLPIQLQMVVHAGGGLGVLLVVTALSVFKPWGRIRYVPRREAPRGSEANNSGDVRMNDPRPDDLNKSASPPATASSRMGVYLMALIALLLVIVVIIHLAGGGMRH